MATVHFFNGESIIIPGAYSTIKSGIKNPALALSFGNTLVIDTGSGKMWGGGSGINGTLKKGKDAHYTFDNVRDFRNFVRGGIWWALGGPMFFPGGGASAGINSLTYIKAKTTVPATITLAFGDQTDDSDGDGSDNNGQLIVQVRDEGFVGNGVLGDETRAQSTINVTNAGSAGNEISISFDDNILASYTVQSGDGISNVVAGLAASIAANKLSEVVSSSSTQLIIKAPRGYADAANGISNLVSTTGSVAATSGFYSGGVEGALLTRGYAAKVIEGVNDPNKYIVEFWRGTFKGVDDDLLVTGTAKAFDGLSELATKPERIAISPEVSTVQELVNWMQDETASGFVFNKFFKLSSYTIATTDTIIDADLTSGYIKAEDGSETADIDDLNDALDSIEDLTFDFILCDDWGTNARSAKNLAIQAFVNNSMHIKPDIYVAGGSTVGEYDTGAPTCSVELAEAFNDMNVTIVHGGAEITDIGGRTLKQYNSLYKAANVLGREAGLPPQVPLAFKGIGIQGEVHKLTRKEVIRGLQAGVLITRLDGGSFEIVKGVNTLQNNQYLVNPDGTTHDKQLARIIRQINKEITIAAKATLLKKENGPNRNTVSVDDVREFVKGFLQDRVARPLVDNLIITFRDVDVVLDQDAYRITYGFEGNTAVHFLLFTGFLLDSNS